MMFINCSPWIFFYFTSFSPMSLIHLLHRPDVSPWWILLEVQHTPSMGARRPAAFSSSLKSDRNPTANLTVYIPWHGHRQRTHVYSPRGVTETCFGCHQHAWGTVVLLVVRLRILGRFEEIPLLAMKRAAGWSIWVNWGPGQRREMLYHKSLLELRHWKSSNHWVVLAGKSCVSE